MEVDFLKAEHAVLLDLCEKLRNVLNGAPRAEQAIQFRTTMNRVLVSHLAKEDEHLYPILKRDQRTAATAARFERELGGLASAWRSFMTDWPADTIATDWAGFGAAARTILDALTERVRHEEEDLYALLVTHWPDAA